MQNALIVRNIKTLSKNQDNFIMKGSTNLEDGSILGNTNSHFEYAEFGPYQNKIYKNNHTTISSMPSSKDGVVGAKYFSNNEKS
jgi:hypothetical protein